MIAEQKYMQRSLQLAALGNRHAPPNPMVGCVIVHQDRIIGEGWHRQYGGPHAEVNAFKSILPKDKSLIPHAIVYVNLEPCCFHGKTPACTDLLLQHRPTRVVVANLDPNPKVAGKGITILQQSGIEIQTGLLEKEGAWLNRRFFTFHKKKRPYILLKWAQTSDGFFVPSEGRQQWITNELSRKVAHRWRSEEMAIMIGTNTATTDNAHLNDRYWGGPQPTRVTFDLHDRLPEKLHLLDHTQPTIVFTVSKKKSEKNLHFIPLDLAGDVLQQVLFHLHSKNIISVMIEGGARLISSFIEKNLWDEARILTGNVTWGKGIKAPDIEGHHVAKEKLGSNELRIFTPKAN